MLLMWNKFCMFYHKLINNDKFLIPEQSKIFFDNGQMHYLLLGFSSKGALQKKHSVKSLQTSHPEEHTNIYLKYLGLQAQEAIPVNGP